MKQFPWFTALALLGSCGGDDTTTCLARGCQGGPFVVPLVDDAGAPVTARGDVRVTSSSGAQELATFDCSGGGSAAATFPRLSCSHGELTVFPSGGSQPGTDYELRFATSDAAQAPWQPISVALRSQTDPDFNGPGCPCTYWVATASPVLVPLGARLPSE